MFLPMNEYETIFKNYGSAAYPVVGLYLMLSKKYFVQTDIVILKFYDVSERRIFIIVVINLIASA